MHRFEKSNNLSINIFEIIFHHYGNHWEHNLIPIEIKRIDLERVVVLLKYRKSLCSH